MRRAIGETVFFFHVTFVIFWCALFLIPESIFPDRVSFHFYLSLLVMLHQIFWGLIILPWTGRYRMVCILTTITQLLRKESVSDPKNYEHSFNREFLNKFGIKISNRASSYLTFAIFTLSAIQYFLEFRG